MGKRGPRPTPSNILVLEGSHRGKARAKTEIHPEMGPGECPEWLPEAARAEWQRVSPELERLGLLTGLDQAAFISYCICAGTVQEATERIAQDGAVTKGSMGQLVASPWVTILNTARADMLRFGKEFGMSPAARVGLKVQPPAEIDELEVWQKQQRINRETPGE